MVLCSICIGSNVNIALSTQGGTSVKLGGTVQLKATIAGEEKDNVISVKWFKDSSSSPVHTSIPNYYEAKT